MMKNAIVIDPPKPATACIIWLHGLGANGHDFEPIVPQFSSTITRQTRFIFPHAPQRSITINGGMVMPAWYNISHPNLTHQQDAQGIQESEKIIGNYIVDQIETGIDNQKIILAGFSQGGACVLHTGIRYPLKLGGIIALSTYLPLADTVASQRHPANHRLPIFMGHGQQDPVINSAQGMASRDLLQKLNYSIEWHEYPIEHSVNFTEIQDINEWLGICLKS